MKKRQGKRYTLILFIVCFNWREYNACISEREITEEKVKMYVSEKESRSNQVSDYVWSVNSESWRLLVKKKSK